MNKEKNVVEFYVLCNKLKDVVRTGWKDWNVDRFRVESVAEHIYGVQMLAIAMWSEYKYDADISKVITMIAVHEMAETVIGDLTCFQIEREEKIKKEKQVVAEIFSKLSNAGDIESLLDEFYERKTKEAQFVYFCDKLECDLQAKLYDEQGCVDLENQQAKQTAEAENLKTLLDEGMSWSEVWITGGQQRNGYDKNFKSVSQYAKNNKLL